MICPVCNGSGRIRKRFLLFFTRRARCANCLGTGEFPPPATARLRYTPGYVRDDEPFDRDSATTTGSRDRDDDRFAVGSGGRSGGAGAEASWGSSTRADAPVIVDPFAADAASATASAATAEASSSGDDSSSTSASDSAAESSGTSY